MRLLILSDLHLEFGEHYSPPDSSKYDAVVLAGDIHVGIHGIKWAEKTFPLKPVFYIAGNHEYYNGNYADINYDLQNESYKSANVVFLNKDAHYIGDNLAIIGATLWTDFGLFGEETKSSAKYIAQRRLNDYALIKYNHRKLLPEDTEKFYKREFSFINEELIEYNKTNCRTIVITHQCPHENSVPKEFKEDMLSAAYASNTLNALEIKPDIWIHGHTHTSFDYTVDKTRVICNPFGYKGIAENPDFHNVIIEV